MFPIFEGDTRHVDRFVRELTRLGLPFAAHFDHCSDEFERQFRSHPLFVAAHSDRDPESHFDESFRQSALDILIKEGFEWAVQMDVDETLERDAPAMLRAITEEADTDVACFPCLDLWGDARHYRVDGPFAGNQREKVFRLTGNSLVYPHPTAHAPNVKPLLATKTRATVVRREVRILHWGIMDMQHAQEHRERWDAIYTCKVGRNPYGGYEYYFDPATVVKMREVPEECLVEDYL